MSAFSGEVLFLQSLGQGFDSLRGLFTFDAMLADMMGMEKEMNVEQSQIVGCTVVVGGEVFELPNDRITFSYVEKEEVDPNENTYLTTVHKDDPLFG